MSTFSSGIINHYSGHFLISHPNNPPDELARSVLILVNHSGSSAVGIQLTTRMLNVSLKDVSENIGIDTSDSRSRLDVPLYYGGLHGSHRVQVVHTSDWRGMTTIPINRELSVTNDLSILTALSHGDGPSKFRACAGYDAWEDYKLDNQLDNSCDDVTHRWEIAPGTADIAFDFEHDEQWRQSLMRAAQFTTAQWF